MPLSLTDNLNSKYIEAINQLTSKKARRKIIAYVESYDDIYFWRTVLGRFENDKQYFEIMLPSRDNSLERGKKAAISKLATSVGKDMIACVDADYDYLLQGRTQASHGMLTNKYIFHTYVYAIENYQCYAQGLHDVCVMVTLNDHSIFDFEEYLKAYSRCIYPLFVWNVWINRQKFYTDFTITEFGKIINPGKAILHRPEVMLEIVYNKVERKVHSLRRRYVQFEQERQSFERELEQLGVTPDNTYLFIQGHHLFNYVVAPIVTKVCDKLVAERQNEITRTSLHSAQEKTELACYSHSIEEVKPMMKKNTYYQNSEPFQRLLKDVENYLSE